MVQYVGYARVISKFTSNCYLVSSSFWGGIYFMLFKSPCCLKSDSCSILFLQYPNDGDMVESKGVPRKFHDTFFTNRKTARPRGREFHRHFSEDLVVLHCKDFLTFELFGNRLCWWDLLESKWDKWRLHTPLGKNKRSHYAHVGCFCCFWGFWTFLAWYFNWENTGFFLFGTFFLERGRPCAHAISIENTIFQKVH